MRKRFERLRNLMLEFDYSRGLIYTMGFAKDTDVRSSFFGIKSRDDVITTNPPRHS